MKITKAQLKETLRTIMKEESEYQQFFRKALDKAGKSITDMSDEEKKAFFTKIDAAWDGKGEKNEGNAFGAAVTAAKEKGEDEFKVGGKTYKVESVNEEKYTVIDPKGNQKGAGPKMQAASMAKKLGGEKTGHFVVANKNALKARRALEKFKGDFKNPKLKDMMADLYYESVITEQLVPVDKKAVDAFFDKKGFEGKNLNSDGKTLKTVGIGSQEMYIHTPNGVKFVGKVTGKYAQSVVQYVNKNHKSDLSETITEGRAFINAAKKAKAEGKTEFEFNGKTYPVTIKD
jgi:hypothetical protein